MVTQRVQRLVLLLLAMAGTGGLGAQNTVGLLGIDETKAFPGYNLFFPHNQSTVFLVDNCGRLVHRWTDGPDWRPGNAVYLLENGNLVKCKRDRSPINDPIWAGGGGEVVEIRSWTNELLHRFALNDSTYRLHHDVAPMPSGHLLMIAWERFDSLEALAAGRDPAKLDEDELWSEIVLEWDPEADSIVWSWRVWDHLVQDHDPERANFGVVAEHPERIDINYDTHDGHPDWLHINAIDYNPALDQLVLCVPYFNEFWVIDHSTTAEEAATGEGGRSGRGGDLLYRWGNPAAYRQGDAGDQRLFFPHDSHWTDPAAGPGEEGYGRLAVFNNRVHPDSSTAEYLLSPVDPADGSYAMANGRFGPDGANRRLFHPSGPQRAVSASVSSLQRLPNGNTLVMSGRWGFAYELTPDEEVVWEFITPIQAGQPARQGDTLGISDNLTFRLKRYPEDFAGFAGRDLSPKGYIETDPNVGFCGMLTNNRLLAAPGRRLQAFPNPLRDRLTLAWEGPEALPGVLTDLSGRAVWTGWIPAGTTSLPTDHLPAGMYFLTTPRATIKLAKP